MYRARKEELVKMHNWINSYLGRLTKRRKLQKSLDKQDQAVLIYARKAGNTKPLAKTLKKSKKVLTNKTRRSKLKTIQKGNTKTVNQKKGECTQWQK